MSLVRHGLIARNYEVRNTYKILVRKPKGKIPFEEIYFCVKCMLEEKYGMDWRE
jgi:hypothetical protein